jgi:hypothetical protein
MDNFSHFSLLPLPPLSAPHCRLVQSSRDQQTISGTAILTNQNGSAALERTKELRRRKKKKKKKLLTPFQQFPPMGVPGPVLDTGNVYTHSRVNPFSF